MSKIYKIIDLAEKYNSKNLPVFTQELNQVLDSAYSYFGVTPCTQNSLKYKEYNTKAYQSKDGLLFAKLEYMELCSNKGFELSLTLLAYNQKTIDDFLTNYYKSVDKKIKPPVT